MSSDDDTLPIALPVRRKRRRLANSNAASESATAAVPVEDLLELYTSNAANTRRLGAAVKKQLERSGAQVWAVVSVEVYGDYDYDDVDNNDDQVNIVQGPFLTHAAAEKWLRSNTDREVEDDDGVVKTAEARCPFGDVQWLTVSDPPSRIANVLCSGYVHGLVRVPYSALTHELTMPDGWGFEASASVCSGACDGVWGE